MPHVLVAGKIHAAGIDVLRQAQGVSFDYVEDVSEAAYLPHVAKADALVIRTQPLRAETIARASNLRVVSRHGVGYDAVDVPALTAREIALTIVGDVNTVSVAEHAMMLLLAASKRALRADRAVRDRAMWGWRDRLEPTELHGKRLLILGYGRIGRNIARLALAFGMDVRASDPFLEARGWPDGPVRPVALHEGLAWADAVSVSVPRADRPLIGAAELGRMKPSAVLVNTARGGIVEEAALIDALRAGQLAAAGLDVFDTEPPDPGNPLLALDTAILSPHVAGLTAESAERMAVACVRNALDYLAGRIDPDLVVNGAKLNVA